MNEQVCEAMRYVLLAWAFLVLLFGLLPAFYSQPVGWGDAMVAVVLATALMAPFAMGVRLFLWRKE